MDEWDSLPSDPVPPGRRPSGLKIDKKFLMVIAAILIVAGVAAYLITGPLSGKGKKDKTGDNYNPDPANTTDTTDTAYVDPLVDDLDAYYSERGTLVAKIPVNESKTVRTETEITAEMESRGFIQYPVTSEYTMDGKYGKAEPIPGGNTKHPMYTTYFVSSGEDVWSITDVNGTVVAYPVTYNLNSTREAQLAIVETDSIMSYDSGTRMFYETIPNTPEIILKKVRRIDADTLERLNTEGIDSL